MVSFIYDDKLNIQFLGLFDVMDISNRLYGGNVNRILVFSFFSSSYEIMTNTIFIQALAYLIYQFCTMGNDKNLNCLSPLYAVFIDVADDRCKQTRFACSCWHLKHHVVHLIPRLKDFFLRFLLIRTKIGIIFVDIRITIDNQRSF